MSGILIYFEFYNNVINDVSFELLGEAYRLSQKFNQEIYIIAVGKNVNRVKEYLKGYPITKAYLYELNLEFQADIYEEAVSKCIDEITPSIVLIGGTEEGRSIAPRLATRYKTGLTADCTELDIDKKGNLLQIRPAFGGNIMAEIITEKTRPQFATVRKKVMKAISNDFDYNTKYIVENVDYLINQKSNIITENVINSDVEENNILNSDIIVVAGRGIKKKDDLQMVKQFANLIGASFASSRALVEKGWTSNKEQIGLSGNTVCPKCIITFGVSGTIQFMAGMKTTPNIIAVNNDKNARIFEIAHYPICADLYEVLPIMINTLKKSL